MIYLNKEEQHLAECFILLPFAKRILENDRKAIQQSHVKFQGTYLDLIDQASRSISDELRNIRCKVIHQKMKVVKQSDLRYLVLCRGYEEKLEWVPSMAAQLVKSLVDRHLTSMGEKST